MASIFTHPAVPLALALAVPGRKIGFRLLIAGIGLSLLPDLDVIGLKLGITYSSQFGHRGFTHSLLFAAIVTLICVLGSRWLKSTRVQVTWFCFASAVSHPLLDMLTHSGKGVALFWPLNAERVHASFTPVEAAALSASRFFGEHGWRVFQSELVWIWLPIFILALAVRGLFSLRR